MTERLKFKNRTDWLAGRAAINGIGASEAWAAASGGKDRLNLWKEKTGRKEPDDLSDNPDVQRGIRMEGAVRQWFAAAHPELIVTHHPFDILYQTETPWCFATLDGELTEKEKHEQGVIEIKNVQPRKKEDWQSWDGRVPDRYYMQILHQYNATKRKFFWLVAALYQSNGDVTIREYLFKADEAFRRDAAFLMQSEELFLDYVKSGQIPPCEIVF